MNWDKGRAIKWLMDKLDLTPPQVVPLYLGDDTTDEDAFCALADIGITLRVSDEATHTQAQYLLPDTDAVAEFFSSASAAPDRTHLKPWLNDTSKTGN